jgi:streptogramin lyase
LWFTDEGGNIGRMTTSGAVTEFTVPTASSELWGITAGPDGNLWFTEINGDKIGRITTSGTITEFSLPPLSAPVGITAGPDGNLWFTESVNQIGRITASGTVSAFATPTAGSAPQDITAGPDGNLWFTESVNQIGRITASGTITEFSIPTAGSRPRGITAGPDGNLWFTEYIGNNIGRIDPSTGHVTEFSIPTAGSLPAGLTLGLDGNLWFTESGANQIGRITTAGTITEFSIPTGGSFPEGITAGPDGNLWFTETGASKIGQVRWRPEATLGTNSLPVGIDLITATYNSDALFSASTSATISQTVNRASTATGLTSSPNPSVFGQPVTLTATVALVSPGTGIPTGTVTFSENGTTIGTTTLNTPAPLVDAEFPTPTGGSGPDGITAGPDGNLWFTEGNANQIGRITPSGTVTEFSIPTGGSSPGGITMGPDGNLWFTEDNANQIGRITPSGTVTEFSIPTARAKPWDIAAGPDGNLWFTEISADKIGRITTSGAATEFSVPTPSSSPQGITAGPDGNLWFTEAAADKIGRITTSGIVAEFSISTALIRPVGIAAGPDGNLWFTEASARQIGQITTLGSVTELSISTASSEGEDITLGPDGNLWFTEAAADKIGRITSLGTVSEFTIPTAGSEPIDITAGLDGNLWFTELSANKIGRLRLSPEATLVTNSLPAGTDVLTAMYNGDANFHTSTSAAISQTVNRASTATTLMSSANPSVFGQAVTFTVTVSAVSPGASTPSGTVTFRDGGVSIGSGTLSGGSTTFTDSSLSLGIHTITDSYGGDTNCSASSSAAISQTVNRASTATTLTNSANPSVFGQAVIFTVIVSAVSPGAGTPSGTVTFRDGGVSIGSGTLSGGTSTFTTSSLSSAIHTITASYGGDANFNTSTSAAISQSVNRTSAPLQLLNVAQLLTHSQEHYIDYVSHLYLMFLRRAADVPGLNGWINSLFTKAETEEQVAASFLASTEYVTNHGGFVLQTPGGLAPGRNWIIGLYNDVLGRLPAEAEIQGWLSALMNGEPPFNVAFAFVGGAEKEHQQIIAAYMTFLGRAPSADEINAYFGVLQNGLRVEDLRGDFVGSPEYYFRAAKGNGQDSTWVASAFMDVLGRSPSGHETNDIWDPILAITSSSAPSVAPGPAAATTGSTVLQAAGQVLAHSQAHYIDFVAGLYQTYLRRAADIGGLVGWVDMLFSGQLRDEQVTAAFLSAPEYVNNHGGFVNNLPGRGWVIGLYSDVLGRAPSESEIQGVLGALAGGAPTLNLALVFTDSTEKQTEEIVDGFMTLLGRAPSQTEINQYLGAFQSGLTVEDLRGNLIGSPEYFSSPTKGNGDDASWVRSAYAERDILFRMPSDHEVKDIWVPILARAR